MLSCGGPACLLLHRGPMIHWGSVLRSVEWSSKAGMRPDAFVFDEPLLTNATGLTQALQSFAVERFVPGTGVEAPTIHAFSK